MKHLAALSFCVLGSGASAQLTITDSLTEGSIAQLLEGLNVSILNTQVNCAGAAIAHFTGQSEMEIGEGLMLTTGIADWVAGPPASFVSNTNGTPGDPDLELSLGVDSGFTFDACVLEFDCIPLGDTLLFNFSFGSDEYSEFVGSTYNDVFAIWITGPGYPTPTNVAALPNGVPVAINNVNAGTNSEYFHDNHVPPGQFVGYDGFTTNLTAFAVVSPDDVYHFKVAITDVVDAVYDSGVFLEAFSFRSTLLTTGIPESAAALRLVRDGDQLVALLPSFGASAEFVVVNASGSIAHRARASGDRTVIDVGALCNGIYTLRVLGVPGMAPVRFVKD